MTKLDLKGSQRQKMANISGSGKNYEYPGDKAERFAHGNHGASTGIERKSSEMKDEDKE